MNRKRVCSVLRAEGSESGSERGHSGAGSGRSGQSSVRASSQGSEGGKSGQKEKVIPGKKAKSPTGGKAPESDVKTRRRIKRIQVGVRQRRSEIRVQ